MTPFVYNALAIDSSHPTGMSTGAASESMKLLKEGKEDSDAFEDAKATPSVENMCVQMRVPTSMLLGKHAKESMFFGELVDIFD